MLFILKRTSSAVMAVDPSVAFDIIKFMITSKSGSLSVDGIVYFHRIYLMC